MTDAIEKRVWDSLIDTFSRANYVINRMTDVAGERGVSKGDTLELPYQANPTNASSTSRAAPEAISLSVDTLSVNAEVFFNVNLPRLTAGQRLGGNWAAATGAQMMKRAFSEMDDNLLDYLSYTLAYTTAGTYLVNAAGDSLTDDDINEAEAAILSQDGVLKENLLWICSSYGAGSIKNVAGYVPNFTASEQGKVGIPSLESVNGIPVVVSNAVNRNPTVATTAVSVTSNVATATVAAGHGLQPGMKITTSGHTTNASTAVAISSVTATTVVYPLTACNGALADGTGTISCAHSFNLLVDTAGVFRAIQQIPDLEVVKDFESAASALQVYAAYGRIGHAGRAYLVMSPGSAV